MIRLVTRATITMAVFALAHAALTPVGLGWVAILAFIGYIVFSLYQASQQIVAEEGVDPPPEDQAESQWPLIRKRERGKSAPEERLGQERERARREADCGLTHEERVRFHEIIKGLNDDRA